MSSHRLTSFVRLAAPLVVAACLGCESKQGAQGDAESTAQAPQDALTEAMKVEDAREAPFMDASKPWMNALIDRDYSTAYAQLSSHAKKNVSPAQFVAPEEENAPEPPRIENLTPEIFKEQMAKVEERYGIPNDINHLYVETMDPKVLSGDGDAFETMLAIGGMPESTPAEIRRASLRGSVYCKLTPEQAAKLAEEYERPVDEILKDEDFSPYYNLKFVLVGEGGALKVGYFEFMPPLIGD